MASVNMQELKQRITAAIHSKPSANVQELKQRITAAIHSKPSANMQELKQCITAAIHSKSSANMQELKQRITASIHYNAHQMLLNTWRLIQYRLGILLATKGSHINIYLLIFVVV
ncbi:hypothetical protein AVEN_51402-1 [Araneus ventricosus]|uniref:Uncharacterized protein n=1 Tax=Araneus ventricosus TaxID=182803 RepID=A0A4Y2PQF7_ARAVE|nr:hypothetical protein AVEN_51402-1 [Araneus ventricosus]